jgi:hypothetical protein
VLAKKRKNQKKSRQIIDKKKICRSKSENTNEFSGSGLKICYTVRDWFTNL